jgi:hypothetical protein
VLIGLEEFRAFLLEVSHGLVYAATPS